MNKPITVAREEFAHELTTLVNDTALPAFIKIDTMNNLMNSLQLVAMEEYARDKAEFEKEVETDG